MSEINPLDKTVKFDAKSDELEISRQEVLVTVYHALLEKGYNPVNQLTGYLLSGDPAFIPRHNNARSLIRKCERDELIEELVRSYMRHNSPGSAGNGNSL